MKNESDEIPVCIEAAATPGNQMICDCGHVWREVITLPIPMDIFTKRLKAVACPKCGAGYKRIRFASKEVEEK